MGYIMTAMHSASLQLSVNGTRLKQTDHLARRTKMYGFKATSAANACTLPARAAHLHILRIHQLGNDI
jgi:hypothetical protein